MAPVGTPVLAAEEGEVIYLKDDAPDIPVTEEEYWAAVEKGGAALADLVQAKTNLVGIKHPDGSYTEYLHLQQGSAWIEDEDGHPRKLKVGDGLRKGQTFAAVGMSGITTAPHLHFNRFQIVEDDKGKRAESLRFEMIQSVNRSTARVMGDLWDS